MSGLIRLIIKIVVYVVIVFPLVGAIVGAIFTGWFGALAGFIASAGLALWLESTGKSNQILAKVFGGAASAVNSDTSSADSANIFSSKPEGVKTTIRCPNCGLNVTLVNEHGTCEGCDTSF